ncbi:MAG: hypothetical protein HKN09_10510 [Saprospiraceae bacterium]|nr:hypothetical protein [Saprospiraceae bacterium]
MVLIVIAITAYLAINGYSYYALALEERFYHPKYHWFKPSGLFGQGLGVIGTLLIFCGVSMYILAKRYGFLERFIRLKYLLEFHIFLCTLGPILILFHTTFKFGGIVSIAFWSMVAVVLSGVIGRFIYIQIPRTIEGRELNLAEVQNEQEMLNAQIVNEVDANSAVFEMYNEIKSDTFKGLSGWIKKIRRLRAFNQLLKRNNYSKSQSGELTTSLNKEILLSIRIQRLEFMQKLFRYWHVAHMPFALIMLIIVIIHIAVTVTLGYKWIF